MTIFVNEVAALTDRRIRVVSILASIFSGLNAIYDLRCYSRRHVLLAVILHYFVGVLFAFGFILAQHYDLADVSIKSGALYGLSTGILAVIVWRFAFLALPRPPVVPLRLFIPVVGIAHVPFGIILVLSWSIGQ